jgi:HK97 family phage prohead protease
MTVAALPTPPEAVAPEPDDPHINAAPEESDGVVPVAGDLAPGQCPVCANTNVDPDAANCETCGVPMAADTDAEASEANNADADDVDDGADEDGNINGADDDPTRDAHPKENLVRFRSSGPAAPAVLLRDDGSAQSGSTMFGYFSTFNDWYEIDSYWEGTFLERVAPGAYAKTITEDRANMRVLYDHGFDPQLGNKPIGPINTLREDSVGAYYEVPLLDTDYNRNFVLPALRGQLMDGTAVGSQLGASFRFIVTGESWDYSGEKTSFNPDGLPLRTITATQVLEFGPVTFPANDLATSGVRSSESTTDGFIARLRSDPLSLARFTERASARVVERILALPPSTTRRSASNTTQQAADDVQAQARTRSFHLRARLALAES